MRWLLVVCALGSIAYSDPDDKRCASPNACRPKCEAGDVDACAWVGADLVAPYDVGGRATTNAVAARLLAMACDKNDAHACGELVRALRRQADDAGTKDDDPRIEKVAEHACSVGIGWVCHGRKAELAANDKACDTGEAIACAAAAAAYQPRAEREKELRARKATAGEFALAREQDALRAAPADAKKWRTRLARATKLVDDACRRGDARGCAAIWSERAIEHRSELERACKLDASQACAQLSKFALDGWQDTGIALEQGSMPTADGAWVDYANRACALGEGDSCWLLARNYEDGGNGLPADKTLSTSYYAKSCDARLPDACRILSKRQRDPKQAIAYGERACDAGDPATCAELADHAKGARAIALLDKACALQYPSYAKDRPVCSELAARYTDGVGVAKDEAKAKELRAKGCAAGEDKAC
jgi:TPR repeat protein